VLLAPFAGAIMPLAGWLVDQVEPPRPLDRPAPQNAAAFVQAERAAGKPAEVARVVWVEIPVGRVKRAEHQLLLAAGSEFGLAPGMPVVFGDRWLGRIGRTGASSAEVDLWTGGGRATAIWLDTVETEPALRAVAEGRGGEQSPIVRWIEARNEPQAASTVMWRPAADDPPSFWDLRLRLGKLQLVGDVERGAAAWEVLSELPSGAEGRVFVAVGAVSETVVAEPPVLRMPAALALRADAVFGRRLCGVSRLQEGPASVVLDRGRVLGPVVAARGSLLWCARLAPSQWGRARALGVSATGEWQGEGFLYTRGGNGVPRGLLLGHQQDEPLRPGPQLELQSRLPLAEVD